MSYAYSGNDFIDMFIEERATKMSYDYRRVITASDSVLDDLLLPRDITDTYSRLEGEDEEAARLFSEVLDKLRDRLTLSSGETEALRRVFWVINNKGTIGSDRGLMRNNIFKAAHALGIKLPSFMF
jgi:Fe-S cluster assembly scaffold protein SufB